MCLFFSIDSVDKTIYFLLCIPPIAGLEKGFCPFNDIECASNAALFLSSTGGKISTKW